MKSGVRVDANHRTGATITLLWSGLANSMTQHGYDYLIGCASISMADGGHAAPASTGIWPTISARSNCVFFHAVPCRWKRCGNDLPVDPPPLIKAICVPALYLRRLAWDPDFNTADLPILMPMSKISDRYSKHFIGNKAGRSECLRVLCPENPEVAVVSVTRPAS